MSKRIAQITITEDQYHGMWMQLIYARNAENYIIAQANTPDAIREACISRTKAITAIMKMIDSTTKYIED